MTLKSKRAPLIRAEMKVPGDKSISHRALLIAALSNGPCLISNLLESEDCLATLEILRQLGVSIERLEPGVFLVQGTKGKFVAPARDLDCGNSGTSARLLAGILAAQPFRSRLIGDRYLSLRPMARILDPLRQMGAKLMASGPKDTLPLEIEGMTGSLSGISYRLPVASAQVKSAILLAGLFAQGKTTVIEPILTRDHTECMLNYFLVHCTRRDHEITLEGGQIPESREFRVPGDLSSAAFWLVAAAAQPGSRLLIQEVGLNPTRTGILNVLIRMGARIREVVEVLDQGEYRGSLDVQGTALHGTTIEGDEIPNVIDELPILAVAGALAQGTTVIRGAAELRVKETDRIAAMVENLRAMGASIEEFDDGMAITGGIPLKGAELCSYGDHRIAMACAIAGTFASGETLITDIDCIHTSYPEFQETLRWILGGCSAKRWKSF